MSIVVEGYRQFSLYSIQFTFKYSVQFSSIDDRFKSMQLSICTRWPRNWHTLFCTP